MSFLRMKVKGDEELRRRLLGLRGAFLEEMKTAIPHEARALLDQADQTVPRESGELAGSTLVTTEVTRSRVTSAASYTDDKAAAVHEGVHWGVKFGDKEPGFKWYEKTMRAFAPGFAERMLQRLRNLVGGE